MQVLAVVGVGRDVTLTTTTTGHQVSLMDNLGFMLNYILLTAVFNSLNALDYLMPNKLRKLKISVARLRLYMEEAVLRNMQQALKARTSPRAQVC